MAISDEAMRQRLSASMARHHQLALVAKTRIEDVLAEIKGRITASMQGTPVDDDGDQSLNASFDSAVAAIEDMRNLCVDSPRTAVKPSAEPTEVTNDEDDENKCGNIPEDCCVAIFGGEVDQQKLDRIREQTGLHDRLTWYANPSVYRLVAAIRAGKTVGVVVLTSLISHCDFGSLQAAWKERDIATFMVKKPGINTIIAALGEIDATYTEGEKAKTGKVAHTHIRGPYKYDTIAAQWFSRINSATQRTPLGEKMFASELFRSAGFSNTVDDSERKRLGAVMTSLGWKRVRGGEDPTYQKMSTVADILSSTK